MTSFGSKPYYIYTITKDMDNNQVIPMNSCDVMIPSQRELYDRILKITGMAFCSGVGYRIHPRTKLALKDDKLHYYLTSIDGICGKSQEFDIMVEKGEFVVKKGDLSYLETALNLFSQVNGYRPEVVILQRSQSRYLTSYVENWIKSGCPDIGINYNLTFHFGDLLFSQMEKGDVRLSFIGLTQEYLKIEHLPTKQIWIFTDRLDYAHAIVPGLRYLQPTSDFYNDGHSDKCMVLTYDMRLEAETLLEPFISALKSFN